MRIALPSLFSLLVVVAAVGCTSSSAAPDPCLDVECGAATCEVVDEVAECVCPVGYAFEAATLDCVLEVLPSEVGFDDPRWTIDGGTVDGMSGDVTVGSSCDDFAISTEVGLPEATPNGRSLVLEIEYVSGDCDVQGSCVWDAIGIPFLTLDGRSLPVEDSGDGAAVATHCLGPAFLPGDTATLEYGIDVYALSMPCDGAPYWLESLSNIAIREADAGECPETPGLEDPADFPDLSVDGWEVFDLLSHFMSPPAMHRVVMDPAGDYYSVTTSSAYMNRIAENAVQLRREVNVPEGATGLALAIDLRSDIDMEWGLLLGDEDGLTTAHASLIDDSSITRRLLCVPAWARGTITELSVFLGASQEDIGFDSGRTGTIELHGVEFIDEPACGDGALLNGDFEGTEPAWWDALRSTNDDLPSITIESEPDGMGGTNHYASLSQHKVCSDAGIRQDASVPAGANYLRFRYRTAPGQIEDGRVEYGGGFSQSLPPSETWAEVSLCLPLLLENDPLAIEFTLGTGGSCANTTPDYLEIDDVELVTDVACTPPVFMPET